MEGEKEIVVVAGATGRTGRLIVKELLAWNYTVRAIVRSPVSSSIFEDDRIEMVARDLTSVESLEKALEGAKYLISAIGSKKPFSKKENNLVDNIGNQNLAKAALRKGIEHMVVISSIGVGNSRQAIGFFFRLLMTPVLRMKEKSEEFIKNCGISYTIIRPGGLSDNELPGKTVFGEGGKISGSVSRKEIAKVCVEALKNRSMKNRVLEVVNESTLKESLRQFIVELNLKE